MSRKLSGTAFILSQIILLAAGLIFISWLYLYLQGHSDAAKSLIPTKPITNEPATLSLNLTSPEDDLLSFNDTVLVSGQTQKNLQILVSSSDHDLVIKSDNSGNFSVDFPLEEGGNNITVAVFDSTGDSRTDEKIVYYSKEKI